MVGGVPEDRRMRAVVEMHEAMGSEAYVHFHVPGPALVGARGGGDAETAADENGGQGSKFVARVHAHTRVDAGDPIELAVDTGSLHFFEPATGNRI